MASKKSPYDYEPLALDEQKASFRDDPVKLNMTDGSKDPINDGVEGSLGEPYSPSNQTFERTSSQKDI